MIETARLLLRPPQADDLDLYCALLTSAEVTYFLPFGRPYRDEQIRQELEKRLEHWRANGFGSFTVIEKDQGRKVGYVGVEQTQDPACFDIRYAIIPEAQGQGLAFEAAQACLSFSFKHSELALVYGVAVAENLASIGLLKKLGMQPSASAGFYACDDLRYFSLANPHLKAD